MADALALTYAHSNADADSNVGNITDAASLSDSNADADSSPQPADTLQRLKHSAFNSFAFRD